MRAESFEGGAGIGFGSGGDVAAFGVVDDEEAVGGGFLDEGVEGFDAVPVVLFEEGGVDFDSYLKALSEIGYKGYLTIEREVGENPTADIRLAVEFLRSKVR